MQINTQKLINYANGIKTILPMLPVAQARKALPIVRKLEEITEPIQLVRREIGKLLLSLKIPQEDVDGMSYEAVAQYAKEQGHDILATRCLDVASAMEKEEFVDVEPLALSDLEEVKDLTVAHIYNCGPFVGE